MSTGTGADQEVTFTFPHGTQVTVDGEGSVLSGGRATQPQHAGAAALRAAVAEEIARAIEESVCGPGVQCADRFCPDCTRHGQAMRDAALARRTGGAP